MVFITLVCSYLSSTLLKINAEQIIKLSSPNLGKSFALIAAVKAKSPNPESPLPLSDLVWGAGSEDFLAGVGSPYWGPEVPSWDRGSLTWGWDADGWGPLRGLSGTVAPSPSYIHRHTHTGCIQTHTDSLTPTRTLLTLCCWELVPFVWPQKGPVTGLNGPPAPAEQDSFRQLMPQACLVPVLATSAEQVVRRVPGLGKTCPGRPLTPSPLGPEGSLQQKPFSREWQFHAIPRRPSCAPAGPGIGQPCRHPAFLPTPRAGPGPSSLFHVQVRARALLSHLAAQSHWPDLPDCPVCGCPHCLQGCPVRGLSSLASEGPSVLT